MNFRQGHSRWISDMFRISKIETKGSLKKPPSSVSNILARQRGSWPWNICQKPGWSWSLTSLNNFYEFTNRLHSGRLSRPKSSGRMPECVLKNSLKLENKFKRFYAVWLRVRMCCAIFCRLDPTLPLLYEQIINSLNN